MKTRSVNKTSGERSKHVPVCSRTTSMSYEVAFCLVLIPGDDRGSMAGTVSSRDAAIKRTGMYPQRVPGGLHRVSHGLLA